MKKSILCFAAAILTVCGCASTESKVFREKIVPDIEQIMRGDNEAFKAYEEAISAAEAFASAPDDSTGDLFIKAAEKSDAEVMKSSTPISRLSETEYTVMEKMNISRSDYEYLFEAHPADMKELAGWSKIAEWAVESRDVKTLEHMVLSQSYKLELEKLYLVYGSMDFVVDTDKADAEYFRNMIYKYPYVIPKDCEWLADHDEITEAVNKSYDIIEEKIIDEQKYLNEQNRDLREMQKQMSE